MAEWKTSFTLEEMLDWKYNTKDLDLRARIDMMIQCLGACISNDVLVTVTR